MIDLATFIHFRKNKIYKLSKVIINGEVCGMLVHRDQSRHIFHSNGDLISYYSPENNGTWYCCEDLVFNTTKENAPIKIKKNFLYKKTYKLIFEKYLKNRRKNYHKWF